MKKVVFILVLLFMVIGVLFWLGWGYNQRKQNKTVNTVIELVGGEKAIKRKCIEQNTSDITLSTGESYKRILSLDDIARIDKICNCAVDKAYIIVADLNKELSSKFDLVKKIQESLSKEESIDFLLTILVEGYNECELEILNWLDNEYKSISLE